MNKLFNELENTWEIVQREVYNKFRPIEYFEFGETSCKFKKGGKVYQVKIKEITKESTNPKQ